MVRACLRGNAEFSLVMTKNRAIQRAIASIPDTAWTPVRYPGAVQDPDTGAWISDAEVAEVTYTAFAATKDRITARLVVRRVKDARYPDALFPVWRYHPFFTNTDLPTAQADIVHRRHAIIETVFADLIDGPLAHLPSGHFGANSAWALCAAIAHNLLHAAGTLAGQPHTRARGATLRRQLITVPARLARPARTPVLHLPSRWPWAPGLATAVGPDHRPPAQPSRCLTTNPPTTRPEHPDQWKSWTDQRLRHASDTDTHDQFKPRSPVRLFCGSRLNVRVALVGEGRVRVSTRRKRRNVPLAAAATSRYAVGGCLEPYRRGRDCCTLANADMVAAMSPRSLRGLQTERVTHHRPASHHGDRHDHHEHPQRTRPSDPARRGRRRGASCSWAPSPTCSSTAAAAADQSAAHHLVHAGLIAAATLGLVGQRVAAVLTPAGHHALDAYALAA